MQYVVDGIDFTCNMDIEKEEAEKYIDRCKEKGCDFVDAKVLDDDKIELSYAKEEYTSFERIRRITGYLVGTLDRFNDAKRAEEHDRVKHSL